jgi:hypothetical protein
LERQAQIVRKFCNSEAKRHVDRDIVSSFAVNSLSGQFEIRRSFCFDGNCYEYIIAYCLDFTGNLTLYATGILSYYTLPDFGFGSLLITEQSLPLDLKSSPYYYHLEPIDQLPIWTTPFVLHEAARVVIPGV